VKVAGLNALVTGANRGVGAALVDALFDRGAAKVYAGVRDPDSLHASVLRYGDCLVPVRLDVTKSNQVTQASIACPDLDLLIGNAGLASYGRVLDIDDALCREVFEVNVFGPLSLVRAFAPALRERRGGVLFINSLTGLVVSRSAPVYGASKAATRMLALGLREQLGADGVVVTISHPGFIATDMAADVALPKASPRQVAERSLDGWEAGVASVFPDRFAEIVEHAMAEQMPAILAEPQRVMTGLVEQFQQDPLAGQ
jgi:NAD(P)-dependent dehydrogenase (short-subunit alcohol dehydrogenase family)